MHQKIKREIGDKKFPLKRDFTFKAEYINKIKTANKSPTTPPNLLGIERKIAYANKKYHSGWIWVGVTNKLAGIQFSASIKLYPYFKVTNIKIKINTLYTNKSFTE